MVSRPGLNVYCGAEIKHEKFLRNCLNNLSDHAVKVKFLGWNHGSGEMEPIGNHCTRWIHLKVKNQGQNKSYQLFRSGLPTRWGANLKSIRQAHDEDSGLLPIGPSNRISQAIELHIFPWFIPT